MYFPDWDTGILILQFRIVQNGESVDPKARRLINRGRASSWYSYPATATAKIDRWHRNASREMLLSRHRHGTKTRNHDNVAELIFPHCMRVQAVQAHGSSLRGIKRILSLYPISTSAAQGRVIQIITVFGMFAPPPPYTLKVCRLCSVPSS